MNSNLSSNLTNEENYKAFINTKGKWEQSNQVLTAAVFRDKIYKLNKRLQLSKIKQPPFDKSVLTLILREK